MAALNRHLLELGDHQRLGFHPACPVCRQEQLRGSLPAAPLFGRRARAVLATGVLAVSAAAPGVAIAGDPDRQQEGVVAPDQPTADAPRSDPGLDRPGYDPGGDTALPQETGPSPEPDDQQSGMPTPGVTDGDSGGEPGPLEAEPLHDPDARSAPDDAPSPQAPSGEEAPVAPVAPVEPAPPSMIPAPPSTITPAPERSGPGVLRDSAPVGTGVVPHRSLSLRAATPPRDDRDAPIIQSSPPQRTVPVSTPSASTAAVPPGTRIHVVREGESLWSIAADLLGSNASNAAIAREVARLWSLNKERIGTGDPDLLIAGTRLRLG